MTPDLMRVVAQLSELAVRIQRHTDWLRWFTARENAERLCRRWRRMRHINFLSYGSE